MAHAIFGHREHFTILAPLRVNDPRRCQTCLFQTGRVEIEPGQRPDHWRTARSQEPGGNAGDK